MLTNVLALVGILICSYILRQQMLARIRTILDVDQSDTDTWRHVFSRVEVARRMITSPWFDQDRMLTLKPFTASARKAYAEKHPLPLLTDGNIKELVVWALTPEDVLIDYSIVQDNKLYALRHAKGFVPGRKAIAFPEVIPPKR